MDGLRSKMPIRIFNQWLAYSKLEPFGQPWENYLMAVPAYQFGVASFEKPVDFKSYFYCDEERNKEAKLEEFFSFLDAKVTSD